MPLSKYGMELSIEDLEGEEWRMIEGFPGYWVSNVGRVKSLKRRYSKILSPGSDKGYLFVNLHSDGIQNVIKIHSLVAVAFLGKCPDGYEVNHIDLNRSNNRVSNLEYTTPAGNIQHAARNGVMGNTGELNVSRMIEEYKGKELTVNEIARRHGISANTCMRILKGETFYSADNVYKGNIGYKVTPSVVNEIKNLMETTDWSQRKIAKLYNVDPAVLTRIKNGTYYDRKKLIEHHESPFKDIYRAVKEAPFNQQLSFEVLPEAARVLQQGFHRNASQGTYGEGVFIRTKSYSIHGKESKVLYVEKVMK